MPRFVDRSGASEPRGSLRRGPLSLAQEPFWQNRGSASPNLVFAWRPEGPVDPVPLANWVDAIARRHEVLRTRFVEVADGPQQVVEDRVSIAIEEHEQRAADRIADRIAEPVDVGELPLFRLALMRGHADTLLFFVVHHLIFDGYSWPLMLRELRHLASGSSAEQLPPLRSQYLELAMEQRAIGLGRDLEFWKQKLAGLTPLRVPTDAARSEVSSYRSGQFTFTLPSHAGRRLRRLARSQHVSLFALLLSVVKVVLFSWTGADDLAVGTNSSGRIRRETASLLGLFAHKLILRTRVAEAVTFLELLAAIRDGIVDGLRHEALPVQEVVRWLGVADRPSSFWEVWFTYEPAGHTGEPVVAGRELFDSTTTPPVAWGPGEWDGTTMTIRATDARDGVRFVIDYNVLLFEPARISRLAEALAATYRRVGDEPTASIGELRELCVGLLGSDDSI